MRVVVKYKTRPNGGEYLVNREPLSEQTCERLAKDLGMTALQIAVQLAHGQRLKMSEGRSYRLEEI